MILLSRLQAPYVKGLQLLTLEYIMLTLEIRPGEGGNDAASFAQELLNAYTNFATRMG